MPPFPGPVRQIGYVVEDFDRWVTSWLAAGVGPFYVMRGLTQRALYRGRPCQVTLSLGLANTGDMQVEVIQQEDSAPSVYSEFLASGREGFHQLAWWVNDFDSAVRSAEAAGWPVVWSGGQAEGVRYAYVEPSGGRRRSTRSWNSPTSRRPSTSSFGTPPRAGTAPTRSVPSDDGRGHRLRRRHQPQSHHLHRRAHAAQSSEFGPEPADLVILRGDRLARGAESAFTIGELDFGPLAALLRLA